MNLLQRAYQLGAQESAARFKLAGSPQFAPIKAPSPKPAAAPAVTGSGQSSAAKMPAPVGQAPQMPGATPMPTLPQLPPPIPNPVPQLAEMGMQNKAMGALDHSAKMVNPLAKFSAFNMGMTPDQHQIPDRIPPDNGDGNMRGTNFHEPNTREVSQAFNALTVQKNTDFVNSGNEASFATPSAGMDL